MNRTLLGGDGEPGALAEATAANNGVAPSVVLDGDPALRPGVEPVDWPGYPSRVAQCINAPAAAINPLMDWTGASGQLGRALCHEEYLEWRVVRRADGKIVRVEMTTETPDYWSVLARYEPQRVVELAARFAGEPTDRVDVFDIFGVENPFSIDPFSPAGENLQRSYRARNWARAVETGSGARQWLPPLSAYNNGTKAILHMCKGVNTISAALQLAVFAAYPHGKLVNGDKVPLSGPEAITATPQAAVNCRNSDPTIVGVVNSRVFSGSKVALMDPLGLYITGAAHSQLFSPNGDPVPEEWIAWQRGSERGANPVDQDLFQRIVIEVPPGVGFVLGDLLDANGDVITTGAQLARLVTVGLFYRATDAGAVTAPHNIIAAPHVPACDTSQADAPDFHEAWAKFQAETNARIVLPSRNRRGQ